MKGIIIMLNDWKYYKHCAISKKAPHELPALNVIKNHKIFKKGYLENHKTVLFARWTTDFDCVNETAWWYVIKDDEYDISKLKSKRRYEIKKGKKNFTIKVINPLEYKNDIYNIAISAFSVYPEKYRPQISKDSFCLDIENNWRDYRVFLAFDNDGIPCGYAYLIEYEEWIDFRVLKTIPDYEKKGINAAIVDYICDYYNERMKNGIYICDGSKSVLHETNFQDYLIKYFGFRKAYCKLHIEYKFGIKFIIYLLTPFYTLLKKSPIRLLNNIASVVYMNKCSSN